MHRLNYITKTNSMTTEPTNYFGFNVNQKINYKGNIANSAKAYGAIRSKYMAFIDNMVIWNGLLISCDIANKLNFYQRRRGAAVVSC